MVGNLGKISAKMVLKKLANCTNITWSVSNEVRHSYKWLSIKTNFVQDPIKTSNKSNRKNERHPKKAIERMKTVSE